MPLVVALMYNLAGRNSLADEGPGDAEAELDSEETVQAIASALMALGHQVVLIEGNEDAYLVLRQSPPDLVFNICEGTRGEAREAQIPAILEKLGIPYTGSGPLALALSLDKPAAKKHFLFHGIPTPRFLEIAPGEPVRTGGLHFPLFVKPAREGSSMGIAPDAICRSPQELEIRAGVIHHSYRQPVLIEEFLQGREFTVGLIGNGSSLHALPVMEINYDHVPASHGAIYSRRFKVEWTGEQFFDCPARVSPELEALLIQTAADAFRALGCRDLARVDLRLDDRGLPNVLEVNPLPGLAPGYSDFCRIAMEGGLDFVGLIESILNSAMERYRLDRAARPLQQTA